MMKNFKLIALAFVSGLAGAWVFQEFLAKSVHEITQFPRQENFQRQKVIYENEERLVLLNNLKTLKALGIKTKDLIKEYQSNCPRKHQINELLAK